MTQLKVLLGLPSSGTRYEQNTKHKECPSKRHIIGQFPCHAPGPNFNGCWAGFLSAARNGDIERAAMMHEDVEIVSGEWDDCKWIDVLEDERVATEERLGVRIPFISTAIIIKDMRGLLSCGIGDPDNPNDAWRRFTQAELPNLPTTFTADDVGYGDKFLLHNFGFALWDMTWPGWQEMDENGFYKLIFNYTESIRLNPKTNRLVLTKRSEDCEYSRLMWEVGVKSAVTQKLSVRHWLGGQPFDTHGQWGWWKNGDEELAHKWRDTDPMKKPEVEPVAAGI